MVKNQNVHEYEDAKTVTKDWASSEMNVREVKNAYNDLVTKHNQVTHDFEKYKNATKGLLEDVRRILEIIRSDPILNTKYNTIIDREIQNANS